MSAMVREIVGTREVARTWGEAAWTARDIIHARKGGRQNPITLNDLPLLMHGGDTYWFSWPEWPPVPTGKVYTPSDG